MEVMLQNMQPCSESWNILIALHIVPLLLIIRYVTPTMYGQENVYPLTSYSPSSVFTGFSVDVLFLCGRACVCCPGGCALLPVCGCCVGSALLWWRDVLGALCFLSLSLLRTNFLYDILKIRCSHMYLHMTGTSSPLLSGPLAMLTPILDSPVRLSDNNNLQHSPVMPFGTRAMTLPEISGMSITKWSNWELRVSFNEEVSDLLMSCVVVIRVVKCWRLW